MVPPRARLNDAPIPDARRRIMRSIGGKDTRPEVLLRAAFRQAGLTGYRVHRKSLPGSPDISFGKARIAIFVDGCFWHGCPTCFKLPRTRSGFWFDKIERNQQRDRRNDAALRALGWTVVRLWECEVDRAPDACAETVAAVRRGV